MPAVLTASKAAPSPDDTSLQFPARATLAVFKQQERRAKRVIDESRIRIATYMTRFWDEFYGGAEQASKSRRIPEETRIEVNRLWGMVEMIDAALYPQAARVALMPDYAGRGNVPIAQATLNDFLIRHQVQDQVHSAVIQTTLVGASGFKTAYEPGTARPADRVDLEVVPAWNMILDESCTTVGKERFRGVTNWMPLQKAQQKYGDAPTLRGKKLVSAQRTQPTASLITDESGFETEASTSDSNPALTATSGSEGSDGEWVRVVEFYNLVDPMRSKSGRTYLGRMEVWILDQPDGISDRPILVEAMPFAKTSGTPLPPLNPLIFASHPVYPYRYISVVERVMPQLKELNVWRSINAMQARRSAGRIWGQVDGLVDQGSNDQTFAGEDSVVFKINPDNLKGMDPRSALFALNPPAVDPAMREHVGMLNQEFTWATGQSPNMRGEITDATKYEVQAANRAAEIGLKKAGTQLYNTLGCVTQVVLRAIILAMQDASDSGGGFTPAGASTTREISAGVKVAPVGAVTEEQQVDGIVEDRGAGTAEVTAETTVEPAVDGVDAAQSAATQSTSTGVEVKPFPIRVDGRVEMVTIEDLDADFEIQFVDGVRTPLREEGRKQAQLELADKMAELWEKAKKGDVLARVQMDTFCDSYELPSSWRPRALEEAEKAEKARQAEEGKKVEPEGAEGADLVGAAGGATETAADAQKAAAIDRLNAIRQMLVDGDLDGAAKALLPLQKSSPEIGSALAKAAQSPDPGAALIAIVDQLIAGLGGGAPETAPEEVAPEEVVEEPQIEEPSEGIS